MDSDITKTHLLSLDRLYTLNFEQKWTKLFGSPLDNNTISSIYLLLIFSVYAR